jgi:hypothetical protein
MHLVMHQQKLSAAKRRYPQYHLPPHPFLYERRRNAAMTHLQFPHRALIRCSA